jgi:hypothetical protein
MLKAGTLSNGMRCLDRAAAGAAIPGYYRRGESPVPLW